MVVLNIALVSTVSAILQGRGSRLRAIPDLTGTGLNQFTSTWVVQILEKDDDFYHAANQLAEKYSFVNVGQVSSVCMKCY